MLIELPVVRKRAMTLIELLISLSIIVLLTAVALPAFSYYQRRSIVESDAQALVQLFNYARALQNNPDNFSRSSTDSVWNYEIQITNDRSNPANVKLYSVADPTTIIDQLTFSENIEVGYQDNSSNDGNGLKIGFSGKPPKEIITCQFISVDSLCSEKIEIRLSSPLPYRTKRTVTILNTNDTLKQFFSISLN